jgi:hypothetical protein
MNKLKEIKTEVLYKELWRRFWILNESVVRKRLPKTAFVRYGKDVITIPKKHLKSLRKKFKVLSVRESNISDDVDVTVKVNYDVS